jgi:hypothetical protein
MARWYLLGIMKNEVWNRKGLSELPDGRNRIKQDRYSRSKRTEFIKIDW